MTNAFRDDDWDSVERAVVTDTTGAVIAAWEKLNERLRLVALVHNAEHGEAETPPMISGQYLATALNYPSEVVHVVERLRILRNDAAHGQKNISSADALEYVQTVRRVIYEMLPAVR